MCSVKQCPDISLFNIYLWLSLFVVMFLASYIWILLRVLQNVFECKRVLWPNEIRETLISTMKIQNETKWQQQRHKLNIIHSVHFIFYVYCPTNVQFYSLLIVKQSPTCFETYPVHLQGLQSSDFSHWTINIAGAYFFKCSHKGWWDSI